MSCTLSRNNSERLSFLHGTDRNLSILEPSQQLTWADLYLAGILDYINYMAKNDLLEKYGGLRGLVNTVNGLEPIKAWLEKRPATDV